jgi:hypothetical protein
MRSFTMNTWLWPTVTVAVVAGAQVLACGSSGPPAASEYPTFDDGGEDAYESLGDARSFYEDVAPEAPPTQAFARLAAWSPDEAAVDFCVAPHGTTMYEGPLIAQLAAKDDAGGIEADAEAGPPGLSFPQVSAYVALAPQQYDVTVVAAGSATCAGGSLAATALPALTAGSYTTFAIVGDAETAGSDRALSLTPFSDDTGRGAPPSGASLRFVNASPGLASVDFGIGSLQNTNFQALFTNVPFAQAGSQGGSDAGTIDANGYLGCGPLAGVVLSAHPTGATSDTTVGDGVDTAFGTVTTVVLVGGKTGDAANPVELVQCADGATAGWLSACASISP